MREASTGVGGNKMMYDYFDFLRDAEFYTRRALERAMLVKSEEYINKLKQAHTILKELIQEEKHDV